jgi:signal transduction histidine kinase
MAEEARYFPWNFIFMKRIAIVFLLSILLPSILLAVLAVRSLRDQELVVSSQRTQLYQSSCDALTDRINLFMNDVRVFYGQLVDELVGQAGDGLVDSFDELLEARWSQAAAAAVVTDAGVILSPVAAPGTREEAFLRDHADFLTNRRVVEVYQAPRLFGAQIELDRESDEAAKETFLAETLSDKAVGAPPQKRKVAMAEKRNESASGSALNRAPAAPMAAPMAASAPAPTIAEAPAAAAEAIAPEGRAPEGRAPGSKKSEPESQQRTRNVMPMQQRGVDDLAAADRQTPVESLEPSSNLSSLSPAAVKLEEVTAEENEGAVSRLIDGELHVLLWKRHPLRPGLTFWTELDLDAIRTDLGGLFSENPSSLASAEVSFALLDSAGGAVAVTEPGFTTDWSTPFVASEVGQILPRWEVAAYLLDPASLNASARTIRITLSLLILTLLGAVAGGSYLILRSVNEEMRIASQKTDFVSNVSHELKTPLTSIRMFSELLRDAENPDPDKTRQYSGVISKEAARLSRLINRLLDFSRLDRGELQLRPERIDLSALAQETVADYRPQLEAVGMSVRLTSPAAGGPIVAVDRDALSQVIVNLLSNAGKYAAEGREVLVEVASAGDKACLSVTDHGPGISRAHQRRIFEKFYRIDDSITSGVEGSGIGLALCRQIAELHAGTIRYDAGKGGGSTFLIELPLASLPPDP